MVEFCFENWDAFNCFYASEELKRLSAHGAGFIGSIDTYLVQSHTVVEHPSDGGYWLKRFCDSVRGHKEKAGLVPAFLLPWFIVTNFGPICFEGEATNCSAISKGLREMGSILMGK